MHESGQLDLSHNLATKPKWKGFQMPHLAMVFGEMVSETIPISQNLPVNWSEQVHLNLDLRLWCEQMPPFWQGFGLHTGSTVNTGSWARLALQEIKSPHHLW